MRGLLGHVQESIFGLEAMDVSPFLELWTMARHFKVSPLRVYEFWVEERAKYQEYTGNTTLTQEDVFTILSAVQGRFGLNLPLSILGVRG